MSKPVLVVSACLLGELVRYDGAHKRQSWVDKLKQNFELLPVCPEVTAGLGVPRPAVQLITTDQGLCAQGVENTSLDVTASLVVASNVLIQDFPEVAGFILKARSPSCGFNDTPIFNKGGEQIAVGSGLFATKIQEVFPGLPIWSETLSDFTSHEFDHNSAHDTASVF